MIEVLIAKSQASVDKQYESVSFWSNMYFTFSFADFQNPVLDRMLGTLNRKETKTKKHN